MDFNRWVLAVLVFCCHLLSGAYSSVSHLSGGISKVRGVNLGGWLVVEGWIKPSLFDGILNGDMLDGTQVQFKSVSLQKYISAENGGGGNVSVDRDVASSWETFKATSDNLLSADYVGQPGWDNDAATFEMIIVANNLHGDYQLANGYGPEKAKEVLMYEFLLVGGLHKILILRLLFVGGSLEALDNAFSWAQVNNLRCIIDLHAAPGSQNGMEHSASRDGSADWPSSPKYISQSLDVIDFLSSRYADHPALLGIELLNEPSAPGVPLDVLVSYYMKGEWVNEWNATNGSQTDYVNFGRAQLDVYDTASFGWTYWTLKNARMHWDFEWNIRNGYLQIGNASSLSFPWHNLI
ncbi:hypothetical protein QJS10_CPB12g01458 [Acorus calamus]|uniref:Mannan endo-1,4-beta-mannosidase n=1 Tax=Acorus calamus TaxID=4465 RepID=A0AAV9DMW4_ACOCL|nr:hypothetical protein QJS10_CPB12g01458 [Acorus calamus]